MPLPESERKQSSNFSLDQNWRNVILELTVTTGLLSRSKVLRVALADMADRVLTPDWRERHNIKPERGE